jgi:hypothetical protein
LHRERDLARRRRRVPERGGGEIQGALARLRGVAVTSLEEILAAAVTLGLPDLIQLISALAQDLEKKSFSNQSVVDAIDVAADAAEDAKFPPAAPESA